MTARTARNRPAVGPRPGLVHRLKITEPVRLYSYSVLASILTALTLVGALTGSWGEALSGIAAAALAVVPAAEASRATVYSEASHVREVYGAASKLAAANRLERAAGL